MVIFVEDKLKPGVVGNDLADAADITEDTTREFVTAAEKAAIHNSDANVSEAAATLFSGATVHQDRAADVVQYAPGYSLAADYRDHAEGAVNDATHYVDTQITVVGNLAANTFTFPDGTSLRKLIAVKLGLNAGNSGTGALIALENSGGSEYSFLRVNTSNHVEINTDPSGTASWSALDAGAGAIVIDDGTWVLLQLDPQANDETSDSWEVVPVLLTAAGVSHQCNNIDFSRGDVDATKLGLSRSANQRGEVDEFKFVHHPHYLTHSTLASYLNLHTADKWAFGFARLIVGASGEKVDFVTELGLPSGSTIGGQPINGSKGYATQTLPDIALGNADTGTGLISGAASTVSVGPSSPPSPIEIRFDNSDPALHRIMAGATYNTTNGGLDLPAGHYHGVARVTLTNTVAGGVAAANARAWPRLEVTANPDAGGPIELARFSTYIRYASNATLTGLTSGSYVARVDVPFFFVTDGADSLFVTFTGIAQSAATSLAISNCRLEIYRM